ncbi:MAG: M15 family peptidase [Candidatus Asgardarchaeum californiense]|nr:MAG: M15 family peptidase [Candidatus Asgardarchaeum californiense]
MPKFGNRSKKNLEQCEKQLQDLFNEVIKYFDCSVICGHRNEHDQNEAFHSGRSKVKWPNGMHNSKPSGAVDVVPYYTGEGIPWEDKERFILFAGFVLGIASQMDISIRWGGDWSSNRKINNRFFDGPHFELA